MMSHILNLLFLFLIEAPSISQSQYLLNPCLYNREDILPCRDHFIAGVASPGPNQYTVHATRFQRHPRTGRAICIKRKLGEVLQDVEDLGTPQIKFLFSPGAEQIEPENYVNQMLVEYNVVCETGLPAFIQFEALNLEPRNCEQRCRDYVEIDTGAGGRLEFCGNNKPSDPIIVDNGHFTLKLRTSLSYSYPGFRMFVTCISNRSIDPNTCHDYGGSSRKRRRAPHTLDDPYMEVDGSSTDNRSPAFSLTSAQKESLTSMADSLFGVALSQARRKITTWPPPSYSQNDPNDIRSLSELSLPAPTLHPPTLRPTLSPPPRALHPCVVNPRECLRHPVRHKRIPIQPVSGTVQLNSSATLEAVRNENACNPILRSVSSSYLTIAQRIDPVQVQAAQIQFQAELDSTHTLPP